MVEISSKEFQEFQDIMYSYSGVYLKEAKKVLVCSRLQSRLKKLKLKQYREYLDYLKKNRNELEQFVNAITTNETFFFRELEHLDFIIKEAAKNRGAPSVWSAACSTGEEPYSLKIHFLEKCPGKSLSILATDINSEVINWAKEARYNSFRLRATSENLKSKYFIESQEKGMFWYQLIKDVRLCVKFRQHNLLNPMPRNFDFILLRNVMIYFDQKSKQKVINNILKSLKKGGCLILGKTESLIRIDHPLIHVDNSIYRKPI